MHKFILYAFIKYDELRLYINVMTIRKNKSNNNEQIFNSQVIYYICINIEHYFWFAFLI